MSIRTRIRTIEQRRRSKCSTILVAHKHQGGAYTLNGVRYPDEVALHRETAKYPDHILLTTSMPIHKQPPPELARKD